MGTVDPDALDDVQPDMAEVLQEPLAAAAILVRQDAPVTTHELPTRSGGMRSETLTTSAESIAGHDRRRKRLVVISKDQALYLGTTRREVDSASAFYLPAGVTLEINHSDQVFAASATTTTLVSVLVENWAD
jgi:hypothetical protein